MSRLEDKILEIIQQLREEVRINDQRVKQLSAAAAAGDMLKAVYDPDYDGVVDKAEEADYIDGGTF